MVDIMSCLHTYVPTEDYTEQCFIPSSDSTVQVPKAVFHPIIIGGDQLTASRARGAKKAKVHADSPVSRLEGLIPVAEDWHTKLNLLEVREFVYLRLAIIACILTGCLEVFLFNTIIR